MRDKLKSLASDTLIYGISGILGKFLSFLLTPVYSNYLSVSENGELMTVYSVIAFLNIVYSFGMESAFLRFYKKDDVEFNKKVFSNAFLLISSISLIFSFVIFFNAEFFASLISNFSNGKRIVQIAAFLPFLDSLIIIPFALLRMTRRAKKYAYLRFFIIFVTVGMNMLLVVYFRQGEIAVFVCQLIASLLAVLILSKEILQYINFKIDFKMLKEMLIYGLPTLSSGFSAIILQVSDKLFYQAMASSQAVGMYGQNYKLGIPMMMLVSMFETAWKPFYLSNCDSSDSKNVFARVFTYFTIASALIFLITSFYIEFAVRLPFVGGRFINPIYWSGLGIVPIVLLAYFFNGATTNVAAGLYITKNTKYLPIALGFAAVANLIGNFIFIPTLGIYGGAWATLLAYSIEALVVYYFVRKVYKTDYEWKRLFIIVSSAAVVYIASYAFTNHLALAPKFAVRSGLLITFLISLKYFKFFNEEEKALIKKLVRRRR